MEIFHEDDNDYTDWLMRNPSGYVLNAQAHTQNTTNMRLHHADCRTLDPAQYENLTVLYFKVCSLGQTEIVRWVREHYGVDPRPCGTCHPNCA